MSTKTRPAGTCKINCMMNRVLNVNSGHCLRTPDPIEARREMGTTKLNKSRWFIVIDTSFDFMVTLYAHSVWCSADA